MIQTFQSPEEGGIREGPHSFCISRLNSKVIHSVKVEVHDLMSKPITTDGFHNPVIDWDVLVQSIKQDVSCINRRMWLCLVHWLHAVALLPNTRVSQIEFTVIINMSTIYKPQYLVLQWCLLFSYFKD